MEDLISVIVPVYNNEIYLRDSLDSIINQSYSNLEIILIDDGSTDRSYNILIEYEKMDKRIKVITKRNGGICEAMKMGVLLSNGKYIARCDGDDINDIYRYEKQLKYLKEGNYDLIGCYLKGFGNGSELYMKMMESLNYEVLDDYHQFLRIYSGSCINGGGLFGKRDLFIELMPFKKEFSIVEDKLIYLEFHNAGYKIGNLPEVVYNYRVHKKNTSLDSSNSYDMLYRNIELKLTYLFKNVIESFDNIIIVYEREIINIINHIFSRYYPNIRCRFIDEYGFNCFMSEDIFSYDSSKTAILSGLGFIKGIEVQLLDFGYRHLHNLFLLV